MSHLKSRAMQTFVCALFVLASQFLVAKLLDPSGGLPHWMDVLSRFVSFLALTLALVSFVLLSADTYLALRIRRMQRDLETPPASQGPWATTSTADTAVRRWISATGTALVAIGLWQLVQGILAARFPAIPPAAGWGLEAIFIGIPVGIVLIIVSKQFRRSI